MSSSTSAQEHSIQRMHIIEKLFITPTLLYASMYTTPSLLFHMQSNNDVWLTMWVTYSVTWPLRCHFWSIQGQGQHSADQFETCYVFSTPHNIKSHVCIANAVSGTPVS